MFFHHRDLQVSHRSRAPVRWFLRSRWNDLFCADTLELFLQTHKHKQGLGIKMWNTTCTFTADTLCSLEYFCTFTAAYWLLCFSMRFEENPQFRLQAVATFSVLAAKQALKWRTDSWAASWLVAAGSYFENSSSGFVCNPNKLFLK